jgi:hypothetical protein
MGFGYTPKADKNHIDDFQHDTLDEIKTSSHGHC